jgi:hypothetical protein
MSRSVILVACATCGLIGAAAGWRLHPADDLPTVPQTSAPRTAQAAAPAFDWERLREIVRAEVTATDATHSQPEQPKLAAANEPARSPEVQQTAREAVRAIIDSGQWRDADRRQFRESLTQLSADERDALTREVVLGMNNGTIQVLTEDAPL